MPWSTDKQRRWMFATHPAMAKRWAAEEKKAPSPVAPREFPELRARGLVGISDRLIADHLELYGRYVRELAELDAARPSEWHAPEILSSVEIDQFLGTRVCDLALSISGQLKEACDQVEGELQDRGIAWRPLWYLGDSDFWTTDQAASINLPWFLANDALWAVVNENYLRYSKEDVVRILRHETGHALGYAFEIWKTARWKVAFGDMRSPYHDDFQPDPARADEFVTYLGDNTSAPLAHYAQKHPDEDWAETFATWLDDGSRWRETYADRPVALAKLEAVQDLIVGQGAAYGPPINHRAGRRVPYRTLTFTVGEFVGEDAAGDALEAARRQLPEVYNGVVLHEAYFEGLARGAGAAGPGPQLATLAAASYGSVDAWLADLRQAARQATGWVLTVRDTRGPRLRNVVVEGHGGGVPAGAALVLALDAWEHSYAGDYGIRKDLYVAAWLRNVAWGVAEGRLAPPLVLVPPPLAVPVLAAPAAATAPLVG